MNRHNQQLGGNVTVVPDWEMTGIEVDEIGQLRRGKKYDQPGQKVPLHLEKYDGGIRDGFGRNSSGRVAIETDSGNIYYIENGLIINVRDCLEKRRLQVGRLADFNDIEIGSKWVGRTEKGSEFTTTSVRSVNIDCVKSDLRVKPSDDRLGENFDPVFQKVDTAFRVAGVDLQTTMEDLSQRL